MRAESVHVSDKEGDEDAAEQGHGRGREDHHDYTSCHVDQSAETCAHDDLSQLDHAGEGGAVHPGAPLTAGASPQLQLFLEEEEEEEERNVNNFCIARNIQSREQSIVGDKDSALSIYI